MTGLPGFAAEVRRMRALALSAAFALFALGVFCGAAAAWWIK